ncbi:hypothetical protein [Coxiella endosymbiont of Amblyomma nuttalli]|uniref:hypothetical protein n=1 Tax=Coxiella endosymbiont of Amblyomma nuttalli TaxID=2749996 RepID=UPI001BADB5D1|nr:hypothetical protein [Coxiella endosymbiont of Amblyomma nuttalli]QTS83912.1 hypothetical protein CEAn_00390 [Coxiella endosymbiont of Amblyomma nuttalli]
MSKKGVVIASVLVAAVILSGCTPQQPAHLSSPACKKVKMGYSHHGKYHCKRTHG